MAILVFEAKLDENVLEREDVKKFLGRKVQIVVSEVSKGKTPGQRLAHIGGRWNLGGKLDDVNIRDFAHE